MASCQGWAARCRIEGGAVTAGRGAGGAGVRTADGHETSWTFLNGETGGKKGEAGCCPCDPATGLYQATVTGNVSFFRVT